MAEKNSKIFFFWPRLMTTDRHSIITVSVSVNSNHNFETNINDFYKSFGEFEIIRGHDGCHWPSVELAAKRLFHHPNHTDIPLCYATVNTNANTNTTIYEFNNQNILIIHIQLL